MFGGWKCACRLSTLVDAAAAGSQELASFFSAPVSLPASGMATTTTTSQKTTTSHLVLRPHGMPTILLALLIGVPPLADCLLVRLIAPLSPNRRGWVRQSALTHGRRVPNMPRCIQVGPVTQSACELVARIRFLPVCPSSRLRA